EARVGGRSWNLSQLLDATVPANVGTTRRDQVPYVSATGRYLTFYGQRGQCSGTPCLWLAELGTAGAALRIVPGARVLVGGVTLANQARAPITNDGNNMVVPLRRAGRVDYILFTKTDGNWTEVRNLTAASGQPKQTEASLTWDQANLLFSYGPDGDD